MPSQSVRNIRTRTNKGNLCNERFVRLEELTEMIDQTLEDGAEIERFLQGAMTLADVGAVKIAQLG
jgi:hypothetical protein